jgi:putative ABC transport system substrate-binding protein
MNRREFITLLGGGATAWPLAARAQQTIPLVGFVWTGDTSSAPMPYVTAFRQGLKEVGFVEGENVTVEYRWPGSQYDRLPALIAELLQRQVTVIVGNTPPAVAAKAATSTIPIVFLTGVDPSDTRSCRQLQPPRRQCDRRELFNHCIGGEATGLAA